METKVCKKCYQEKDINQFHKCAASKDGFNIYCKLCRKVSDPEQRKKNSQKTLKWKAANPEKWKINLKKAKKQYIKMYRDKFNFKNGIHKELKDKLKKDSSYYSPNLGCSCKELKKYIELQFAPDMNWSNKGLIWEIDHIIPITAFNKEERRYVNHYLNIRPIYSKDNIEKGSIWNSEDKAALIEKINKLNEDRVSI